MHVTKRFHAEDMDLNMTPMIDVVFQLLIFFLVVSEFAKYDRVEDLTLPRAVTAAPEDVRSPNRLIISVDRRARVIIGGRERNKREIEFILAAERDIHHKGDKKGKTSQPVLIQADENARWEVIQDVLEKLSKFGFWQVSLGVKKKEE